MRTAESSPAPLPTSRINQLLAAVGNHEAKALMLASMKPNIIYDMAGAKNLMIGNQGDQVVWRMASNTSYSYLVHTFAPIGLVAEEVTLGSLNMGYVKTAFGEQVGDSLAGHLLAFSERHQHISLVRLFGITRTTGSENMSDGEESSVSMSPYHRYRILWDLLTTSLPTRERDVTESTGLTHKIVGTNLRKLSEAGIVEYDATEASQPITTFTLVNSTAQPQIPQYYYEKTLTGQVFDALLELAPEEVSTSSLYDFLLEKYPDKSKHSPRLYKNHLAQMLTMFERAGYLRRNSFDHYSRSRINLTDPQRLLIQDLVETVDRFQSLDPYFIEEGRRKAYEIAGDQTRFTALLGKARKASPFGKNTDSEITRGYLLGIISSFPGITTSDLRTKLSEQYGISFTPDNILALLKQARKSGAVVVNAANRINRYSLREEY